MDVLATARASDKQILFEEPIALRLKELQFNSVCFSTHAKPCIHFHCINLSFALFFGSHLGTTILVQSCQVDRCQAGQHIELHAETGVFRRDRSLSELEDYIYKPLAKVVLHEGCQSGVSFYSLPKRDSAAE